jgi:hypothetical protein
MSLAKLAVLLTTTVRKQYKENALFRFHDHSVFANAKHKYCSGMKCLLAFSSMVVSKEPHIAQVMNSYSLEYTFLAYLFCNIFALREFQTS